MVDSVVMLEEELQKCKAGLDFNQADPKPQVGMQSSNGSGMIGGT